MRTTFTSSDGYQGTIEINEQFQKALDLMENTQKSVFITGKAGTGKSTLLQYFRSKTRKKIVVLAPTGVAALNVQGETIHSFFGFRPDITIQKVKKLSKEDARIYKELDAIIIDEISMVRADLLDCIDKFLRLNAKHRKQPFGGTQIIFIGDLYQLPPVVSAKEKEMFATRYKSQFFFDADVFSALSGQMEFIELEKIYRQKDDKFINLLNEIRNNTITDESLALLNSRVGAEFSTSTNGYSIHLTTTNEMATKINTQHLNALKTKIFTYSARVSGKFEKSSFPTDEILQLKIDAQVMLLNNDSYGRWVNGSIGKIVEIEQTDDDEDVIIVKLSDGRTVDVSPHKWDIFHYTFNKEKNLIETEQIGSFIQYPMKLAWAVTIHKSQGKTFNRVVIDLTRGTFAGGQVYVALSRCTSFEGIVLTKPVKKGHIFMDRKIVDFLTKYQYKLSERDMPLEEKIKILENAIKKKSSLEILYLKPNDEKSRRIIKPLNIGNKSYAGKNFLGVTAFCTKRQENREFRVDRILEMKDVSLQAD